MQVIDVQIGKRGQRVFFKKLVVLCGVRLLVEIVIDHTDYQSSAGISRWDGAKWQSVYSLHPSQMNVDFSAAYSKEELTESVVESVVERLMLTAEKIVFTEEKCLVDFLNEGSSLCGLNAEEQRALTEANGDGGTHPRVRITLANGKSLIAEGPFESIDGNLKVWTPLEPETFALIRPSSIATVAYSE